MKYVELKRRLALAEREIDRAFGEAMHLALEVAHAMSESEKRRRDRELVAAGVSLATGGICGVGDEEADRLIALVDASLAERDPSSMDESTPWLHCAGDAVRVRDEDGRESVCVLARGTVTDTMGRTHKIGS